MYGFVPATFVSVVIERYYVFYLCCP
ncbi:MAG: hypothetical protein RLZZ78_232, partial [Armatimonadota bacterium]